MSDHTVAAMWERIEGNRMSIITPNGSAHIATTLIDTHYDLVRSMVNATREEWASWGPQ